MATSTGLDPVSTAALVTVLAHPGTSVGDLATTLGLTHSGAVRAAARLRDASLMLRGPGRDGRTAGLRLTTRGETVAREALVARTEFLRRLIEAVEPDDLPALERVLDGFASRLPATRGQAQRLCRLCAHEVCRGRACPVGGAFVDEPVGMRCGR